MVEKKYEGRKLKIKSYGFQTHVEPLDLKAKVAVGLLVIDLNSDVGVGCYFKHLNQGNKFFANTQYADAKSEYYLALECSDVPDKNDLSKKIDDAGTALDAKRAADNYYNSGKYLEAKKEYEKLRGLNPNDNYPIERIAICDLRIPNLRRIIQMKVTDASGRLMTDIAFSTEKYKVDKNGNLKLDNNNKPIKIKGKKSFAQVQATYYNGVYSITVKNVNTTLELTKYIDGKTEYYDIVQVPPTTDIVNVKLTKTRMTKAEIANQALKGTNDFLNGLNRNLNSYKR